VTIPFARGRLEFHASPAFAKLAAGLDAPVRHPSLEQSNTAVYFGDKLFLKGYRRLQTGTNPEVEVGRFLTDTSPYAHIAPVAGSVEIRRADGQTMTLALLQGYTKNQGDSWNFTLDYLERYLSEVAIASAELDGNPHAYFLTLIEVLGRRTGELHQAFGRSTGDAAFEREPITEQDMSNWSNALKAEAVATLDELERRSEDFPEEVRAGCDRLSACDRCSWTAFRRRHWPASAPPRCAITATTTSARCCAWTRIS
jgi:maltose alpha-D-glucosyltransferase/alpha-amylase